MAAAEYFRKDDKKKESVNAWLVEVIHSVFQTQHSESIPICNKSITSTSSPSPFALILEAEDMITLKHLKEYQKVTELKCIIPNPSINVINKISKENNENLELFQVTSHELLDDLDMNGIMKQKLNRLGFINFEIVWLDYCGNFDSKAGRRRQKDIRILFGNNKTTNSKGVGFLAPKSVFALTFSSRGTSSFYEHETVEKVISFIKELGKEEEADKSVELVGIATYSADTDKTIDLQKKVKKRKVQPLYIYTIIFKITNKRCSNDNKQDDDDDDEDRSKYKAVEEEVKNKQDEEPNIIMPIPQKVEGLMFFKDWCALKHIGEKSKLLKALEKIAIDFTKITTTNSNNNETSSQLALIVDSRLATTSCALLNKWSTSGNNNNIITLLPKQSNRELISDIISQIKSENNNNDTNNDISCSNNNTCNNNIDILDKSIHFKDVINNEEDEENLKSLRVLYLDYGEQSPFTASALRTCSDWSDLKTFLIKCIKIKIFNKFPYYITIGLFVNYSPGNIYWEHIEIDWLVSGINQAVHQINQSKAKATGDKQTDDNQTDGSQTDGFLSVSVKHVHSFIASVPRVSIIFQIKANNITDDPPIDSITDNDLSSSTLSSLKNQISQTVEELNTNFTHQKDDAILSDIIEHKKENDDDVSSIDLNVLQNTSKPSTSTSTNSENVDVAGWFSHVGDWSLNRLKIPAESSKRFLHIVDKVINLIKQNATSSSTSTSSSVFLHEPGNFHVLNAINHYSITNNSSIIQKICISNEYDSQVEINEVYKRLDQLNEQQQQQQQSSSYLNQNRSNKNETNEIIENNKLSYDIGTFASKYKNNGSFNVVLLLTDLSIIGFEIKWFDIIINWLYYHASDNSFQHIMNNDISKGHLYEKEIEENDKGAAAAALEKEDQRNCQKKKVSLGFMVENSDKVEKIHNVVDKMKIQISSQWKVVKEDFYSFNSMSLKYAFLTFEFEKVSL